MPVIRKLRKLLRSPAAFFSDAKRNRSALSSLDPLDRKSAVVAASPTLVVARPAVQKVQPVKPAASKPTAPTPPISQPTLPPVAPKTMEKKPAAKPPVKKPVGPEMNFPRTELAAIRFLVHAGDGIGSEYQFLNWLPDVQHAYQHYAVFIRSWDVYVAVRDRLPTCNLIFASGTTGVEEMVTRMRSLSLVLYVSNTGNNLHLLRYNHLTHAFIGHGDSEKSASCHKFFRAYDEIWVSGQAHVDRFLNASFDTRHVNFVRVGRSSLRHQVASAVARMQGVASIDSYLAQDSDESRAERLTSRFFYLPTWEGAFDDSSYSSLEHTGRILEELCEEGAYKGAVKFHPMTGKRITPFADFEKKLYARFDHDRVRVIPRAESHIDTYGRVDFLVADISSVITDFLVTLKPIFVYWPGFKNLLMAESKFSIKDYCYVYSTIDELKSLVQRVVAEGNDDLCEMRQLALDYYVDLKATEHGAFQRRIVQACAGSPAAATSLISA